MFSLPELGYEYASLEPHIDARTMEIHYSKHHAAYVEKLNKALEGRDDLLKKSIEDILKNINDVPEDIRQAVINNGGGHVNHTFFWEILKVNNGEEPRGEFLETINKKFGSFDEFKAQFNDKALTIFGSGWAFLVVNKDKELELTRQSFQNSPLMDGNIPVLGIDVWEHAYYLKYQNKRPEYVEAFWNVVNWEKVSENFTYAKNA